MILDVATISVSSARFFTITGTRQNQVRVQKVAVLTFADHLFLRDDLAGFELRYKFFNGMLSDKVGNHEKFLHRVSATMISLEYNKDSKGGLTFVVNA